ncbi:hypothetical protein H4219_001886 [Mycoemilia scoparia]|uniref:Zn(2)-C6 fungal-type domain-containing protein n=1 Tax=Mycoemilia scoparia TaxID=417184 RepID=A0A9W8A8A5_9FUNG|nr:hypothetical protein H4219_001886 [Mycoemilia scoparia]
MTPAPSDAKTAARPAPATTAPAPAKRPKTSSIKTNGSGSNLKGKSQSGASTRQIKSHVPSACTNCKKAHLACDISRPCNRCISIGKQDTCHDVQHKKRGRPKLRDKQVDQDQSPVKAMMENRMFQFSLSTPSTTSSTKVSVTPAPKGSTIASTADLRKGSKSTITSFGKPAISASEIALPINLFLNQAVADPSTLVTMVPFIANPPSVAPEMSTKAMLDPASERTRQAPHQSMNSCPPPLTSICSKEMDNAYNALPNYTLSRSMVPNTAPPHHASISPPSPIPPTASRRSLPLSTTLPHTAVTPLYQPSTQPMPSFASSASTTTTTTTNPSSDSRISYLFLTPNHMCLRVDDSSSGLLGYTSLQLINRSMLSILHDADSDKFLSIANTLSASLSIINSNNNSIYQRPTHVPNIDPPSSLDINEFNSVSLNVLLAPCAGSREIREPLHIRREDGSYALLKTRSYWGGGFGAQLGNPQTYDRLYKVIQVEKFELGILASAQGIGAPLTPPIIMPSKQRTATIDLGRSRFSTTPTSEDFSAGADYSDRYDNLQIDTFSNISRAGTKRNSKSTVSALSADASPRAELIPRYMCDHHNQYTYSNTRGMKRPLDVVSSPNLPPVSHLLHASSSVISSNKNGVDKVHEGANDPRQPLLFSSPSNVQGL